MILFVPAGLGILWRRRWLGTLGSRLFRRRHGQIRGFLADCATDRLTRLRSYGWEEVRKKLDSNNSADEGRAWNKFFDDWDGLDRALARQCAEILDALAHDEGPPPPWSFRAPLFEELAKQVERWALKALLVSERPREFRQFALPRLTFLYRFSPMMGSELRSSSIAATKASVVSDSDFRLTITNQCNGRPDEIDEIERWAQDQVKRPRLAGRFVEVLNEVGLKAGMTREDFRAMLERMRKQPAPETLAGDLVAH
ncbi:MAG: hypothetical protein ACRDZ4_00915 [Egibacteraceae bacterium]